MFIQKLLIVIFVTATAFSVSANANANIASFDFTGLVTFSDPSLNAPIDSLISGSFSYDLNAPVTTYFNSPPTTYSYYYYSAPNALTINFSGHTVTSDSLGINLQDNSGGNPEDYQDYFILAAYSIKLDGIDYGGFGLNLASSPGQSIALTSGFPPLTLDLALFNNVPYNYSDIVKDGETKLQFSMLSITPVPEPESYALLLAGLGMIGFKTRRKT